MSRTLAIVAIASAPGWLLATLADAPLVGWAVSVGLVAFAIWLKSAGRVDQPVVAVVPRDAGWRALDREVAHARRYRQPLTLLRIDAQGDAVPRLEAVLASCREVDVAWEDDAIWLVAVGTDEVGRVPLIDRIRREVPGVVAAEQVRALSFPGDALTVNALVAGLAEAPRSLRLELPSAADVVDDLAAFGTDPLTGVGRTTSA